MYYYNGEEYSSISKIKDNISLKKSDVVYISDETATILSIKDDEMKIKYDNSYI